MRRTDEEFNAEIFRRSQQYKAQNREKKKKILLGLIPAVCVMAAVLPSIYLVQEFMLPRISKGETAVTSEPFETGDSHDADSFSADESNQAEKVSSGENASDQKHSLKGEDGPTECIEIPAESKNAVPKPEDSSGKGQQSSGTKSWFLSVKQSAESAQYYRQSSDPDRIRPIASAIDSLVSQCDSKASSEPNGGTASGDSIVSGYYITMICGSEARSYILSGNGLFLEAENRMIPVPSEEIRKLKRMIDSLPENERFFP